MLFRCLLKPTGLQDHFVLHNMAIRSNLAGDEGMEQDQGQEQHHFHEQEQPIDVCSFLDNNTK